MSDCIAISMLSKSVQGVVDFNINVIGHNSDIIIFVPVASAPTNLMAAQEGLTSIRVSWSPPTPLGDTSGYRIYYRDGDSSSYVRVSGGSRGNYLLTGLQNGDIYTLSIVATSQHLPSESVTANTMVGLGEKSLNYVCTLYQYEEFDKEGQCSELYL